MTNRRLLPYMSLGLVTTAFLAGSRLTNNENMSSVLLAVAANGIFFLVACLFYDLVRAYLVRGELEYVHQHIRQRISSDVFATLYFLKKILYGYNLDTNTFENITGLAGLTEREVAGHISNQSYLGFQILKSASEVSDFSRKSQAMVYS